MSSSCLSKRYTISFVWTLAGVEISKSAWNERLGMNFWIADDTKKEKEKSSEETNEQDEQEEDDNYSNYGYEDGEAEEKEELYEVDAGNSSVLSRPCSGSFTQLNAQTRRLVT